MNFSLFIYQHIKNNNSTSVSQMWIHSKRHIIYDRWYFYKGLKNFELSIVIYVWYERYI